jgi:hypothetical protein
VPVTSLGPERGRKFLEDIYWTGQDQRTGLLTPNSVTSHTSPSTLENQRALTQQLTGTVN